MGTPRAECDGTMVGPLPGPPLFGPTPQDVCRGGLPPEAAAALDLYDRNSRTESLTPSASSPCMILTALLAWSAFAMSAKA